MSGTLKQTVIPIFCLWHMAAVGFYLMPTGWFTAERDFTMGYVLLLSQWQKWDIFSPDPLRQVNIYRVERQGPNGWEIAMELDRKNLPFFERVKETKVLTRLDGDWKALIPSYLQSLCDRIEDSSGDELFLRSTAWTLPMDQHELTTYSKRTPRTSERILGSGVCPTKE